MSEAAAKARAKIVEEHHFTFDELVALIRETTAEKSPLEESLKWGNLTFHEGKDNYMALIAHKARVNFQIFNGAHLPDPKGMVEGVGKDMRHVKVPSAGFVAENREALAALIRESLERPDKLAR